MVDVQEDARPPTLKALEPPKPPTDIIQSALFLPISSISAEHKGRKIRTIGQYVPPSLTEPSSCIARGRKLMELGYWPMNQKLEYSFYQPCQTEPWDHCQHSWLTSRHLCSVGHQRYAILRLPKERRTRETLSAHYNPRKYQVDDVRICSSWKEGSSSLQSDGSREMGPSL